MFTRSAPLLALLALVPLASAWRLTPLTIDQHPCKPEKLKAQNRYICDSNGNVKCLTGWKDKDYDKNPHFPCAEPICNPGCLNGECKLPNVCVCEIGWDGLDCGTCIDMPGCVNGGCIKTDGAGVKKGVPLTCNCQDNWQGALCDVPKCLADDSDENSKPDCNNHGICVDTAEDEHECKCNLGWGGSTCQECTPLMGCKAEHTFDVDEDGKGDGCKVKHGDEVVQHPNSCQCTNHWTGIFCEQPKCLTGDQKTEITCVNGECKHIEGVEGAFCHCNVGWKGERCDECVPQDGCPAREKGDKIVACVQPNECRCKGSASDVDETTKKCKVWIADGKCADTADCNPAITNQKCSVRAENPLDGTCEDMCSNGMRIRKDYRDLTAEERRRLRKAFELMVKDGTYGFMANHHGFPLTICNPLFVNNEGQTPYEYGCCPHGDGRKFLTWHRLYMVEFEKALGHYLTEEFGDNELGLPYWDWTSSTALPDFPLEFPNLLDRMNRYPNAPARAYLGERFQPDEATIDGWKVEWTYGGTSKTAVQFIDEDGYLRAFSTPDSINQTLREWENPSLCINGHAASPFSCGDQTCLPSAFRQRVQNILSEEVLGSEVSLASIKRFGDLLNDPHGAIHDETGCMMGKVEFAGFHPIFWMHHSMVDKVFADWQQRIQSIPLARSGDTSDWDLPPFATATDRPREGAPFEELAWDYENKLCYKYQERAGLSSSGTGSFSTFSTSSILDKLPELLRGQDKFKLSTNPSLIVPHELSGSWKYELCHQGIRVCEKYGAAHFGSVDAQGVAEKLKEKGSERPTPHDFLVQQSIIECNYQPGPEWAEPPKDVQWTKLSVTGDISKIPLPGKPFIVFHLQWGKSEETVQFVHLRKDVKKGEKFNSQYGTMLDQFGINVFEYCDVFFTKFTDKKTGKVRKICWPLGDDTECRRQGVDRRRQKQECKRMQDSNE